MKVPGREHRRFGSIRILRDGRVRFSEWSFPGLHSLSFTTMGGTVDAVLGSRQVLCLWLDDRHRVATASFPFDLTPDELRTAVRSLRMAGHGLERWIVPALEYTQADLAASNLKSELPQVIAELLESCQELPVAERWKKIRENVFANAANARAVESTPTRKRSRAKARKIRTATGRRRGA